MNGKAMRSDLAFASIRQGDLTAAEGWEIISSFLIGQDLKTAERLCDSLRVWTWKAIDRRRRDAALREWVDVLNRTEGFIADRFEHLAIRVQVLTDLLQDTLAATEIADGADLFQRKHVPTIIDTLSSAAGKWVERAVLMQAIGLKPANATRLMSLLVDVGWVEQIPQGREISYRLSAEGLGRARDFRMVGLEAGAEPHHEMPEPFGEYVRDIIFSRNMIVHQRFKDNMSKAAHHHVPSYGIVYETDFFSDDEHDSYCSFFSSAHNESRLLLVPAR